MSSKPIFDDPELQAEHDALNEIACILAEKWRSDLEKSECNYSMEGIISQYDTFWKYDYEAFRTLVDGHKRRINQYRIKKFNENEEECT